MKLYLVIPAHNEEAYISEMLQSLVDQSLRPTKVIVVNDSSTDNTAEIIQKFTTSYSFIESISLSGVKELKNSFHKPGSKVVKAFYEGLQTLDTNYDFIGKFDSDIILPKDYFEKTMQLFTADEKVGIAGGNLYIERDGAWEFEAISEKTKVRGPIKLYRKSCFEDIGGLKKSIGWDTVDELLAQFHGWKIKTNTELHVKHLKPTGKVYTEASKLLQGEAFYKMRYGLSLTIIAAAKLAAKKNNPVLFINCMEGYHKAKMQKMAFMVTEEEGVFIRKLRWKKIQGKIGF